MLYYGRNITIYEVTVAILLCHITIYACTPLAVCIVIFRIRYAYSFCICLVAKTRTPLSPNRGSVGGGDARTNNLIFVLQLVD